ncbi:unnamed protein product [Rotaria magnacalcarata]
MNDSDGLRKFIDPRFHMLLKRTPISTHLIEPTVANLSNIQQPSQAWVNNENESQVSKIKSKPASRVYLVSKTGQQICSTRCRSIAITIFFFLLCVLLIALPLGLVYGLASKSDFSTSITSITTTIITTITMTTTTTTTTPPATAWIPSNYGTPCSSTCINVTTVTPSTLIASWTFEKNTNDVSGQGHNGIIKNGAAFSTGYVGQALLLGSSLSQYIFAPYINLTLQSFTVEMWIYSFTLSSLDLSLFGECETHSIDQCLHYIIRNYKVCMGFYGDDLVGVTNLTTGRWYHIAYVYDFVNNVQSIYLNGLLEASRVPTSSYMGQNGSVTFGITGETGANYYNGLLDHIRITNRVKISCEILNDASLITHYPFDGSVVDIGPNTITATTTVQGNSGISWVMGKVNQAINFNASNSYFQSCGFWALGQNQPYSIALWINPSSLGGTLFHLSTDATGSGAWCLPMIGFSSNGSIVSQTWNGNTFVVIAPIPPINSWTHIVQTWSSTNGLRLYINGGLYGSVNVPVFAAGGASMCVLLGNSGLGINCQTGQILMGPYSGAIDEFYVYNRELLASEVCPLAHP